GGSPKPLYITLSYPVGKNNPLVKEKPGACPSVDLPQLGICQDQCQEDSQCPGPMKCCRNGCGKVSCVTPDP
uniref:WAP domain-containing protein n=1 Tax=Spermophilus dauricus TaxID=99837 RepID=A0A8C9PBM4_SPEDA